MKALIALTGAVIAVVGTVAYAAPVAAQPGTVRVTFAEWCATRPLGGIDVEHAARDGIRLAPATRGSSVTVPRPWPRPRPGPRDGYPASLSPAVSTTSTSRPRTSTVSAGHVVCGWSPSPRRPSASGQAPTNPSPATAFVFIDGRTGAWIMALVG